MADQLPNEVFPAAAAVALLDGTLDPATGLPYIARGTGPASVPSYEVQYNRRLLRQNRRLALITEGLVVDKGGLTFGVYPFDYRLGGSFHRFEGATQQALPDNATRYVYVDSANHLQIAASEPADLTAFVPLARVVAASGSLTITARTNLVRMSVPQFGPAAAGGGLSLSGGVLSVGVDAATIEITSNQLRLKDGGIAAAKLATSLADALGQAQFTIGAEDVPGADDRLITIQLQNIRGQTLAARHFVRLWTSTSDYGGPIATGQTINVTAGTLHGTDTTNAALRLITDSAGQVQLRITNIGITTRYVLVSVGSRVYSSGAITWNIS